MVPVLYLREFLGFFVVCIVVSVSAEHWTGRDFHNAFSGLKG